MNRVPLYAAHRIEDGLWEIIAPSDDPYTPAYWRVGVVRQHNRALRPDLADQPHAAALAYRALREPNKRCEVRELGV
jgi:hypothetical protein